MKEYTVSQLNNFIKNVFDDEYVLNNIQVCGEISEFNNVRGNSFFVITDGQSSINCIRFGIGQDIKVGSQVLVVGTVKFYNKTGQVSFVANTVKVSDLIGLKHLKFLELKDQLQRQGLLDNKLSLPECVNKVAIITSRDGAVVHDFISVARKLNSAIDIVVCSCKVQGEGSEQSVADAIANVNNMCDRPDCIVLARGGGSSVDLDTFNNPIAVMAVASSSIPIVSAIGHEINYTLCDFVASARAGTPSIAAQMVVPDLNAKKQYIQSTLESMAQAMDNLFLKWYYGLSSVLQRVIGCNSNNLSAAHSTIERSLLNANYALDKIFQREQNSFEQLSIRLDQNNPSKLLVQGYAKLQKQDKTVISVKDVNPDDEVKIFMIDGSIQARVLTKQ